MRVLLLMVWFLRRSWEVEADPWRKELQVMLRTTVSSQAARIRLDLGEILIKVSHYTNNCVDKYYFLPLGFFFPPLM